MWPRGLAHAALPGMPWSAGNNRFNASVAHTVPHLCTKSCTRAALLVIDGGRAVGTYGYKECSCDECARLCAATAMDRPMEGHGVCASRAMSTGSRATLRLGSACLSP